MYTGNDFLQKYQVIINYQTNTLEISKQNQVTLNKGVVLPPNEEVEALGLLQQTCDDEAEFYALLKLRQQYRGVQLGPSQAITFVKRGKVPFIVQNRSHKSAIIPAGEIIGSVTPIKADALVQPKGVHCVKEHIQVMEREETNTSSDSFPEVGPHDEKIPSNDTSSNTEASMNKGNYPEVNLDVLDRKVSLSDPDENLSGYEADVSSTLLSEDLVSEDVLNIPLLLPISQRKPISKQQREYLIEGKSSSDSCQVSITAQAGDSFSRYEDSLEEELSQQLLTAQPRSSTPIITDNVAPLQLPTEMTDSDNPSPKCDAPPPSPVDSDSAEKRVLLIGTIDKIHKQITEAQATQTNEVIVNHSKERKSEIHLTSPIKIEETNQHGLIQYPTDKLLLEQEKNPVISKQDIAEQNKLISETIESIRYPDLNDELRSELKTVLKTHRRAIFF